MGSRSGGRGYPSHAWDEDPYDRGQGHRKRRLDDSPDDTNRYKVAREMREARHGAAVGREYGRERG